jgi:hypothetical protein
MLTAVMLDQIHIVLNVIIILQAWESILGYVSRPNNMTFLVTKVSIVTKTFIVFVPIFSLNRGNLPSAFS